MEPAQYSIPVALYCVSRLFDGLQAAMSRPEIQLLKKGFSSRNRLLVQLLEIESNLVGSAGFEVKLFDRQLLKQFGL